MRLDHISYVTSHDQLSDTVQRLGATLHTAFVDGGIHPRFGTRNFTAPLKNNHYLEVVCPLDHPATDGNFFGRAVSKRSAEGGGWLTWVLATPNISPIEERLGRPAAEGHRRKPDGTDLRWKQIGVSDILEDKQLPFFIEWLTTDHPSKDGAASATITKVEFSGDKEKIRQYAGSEVSNVIGEVEIIWVDPTENEEETGIVAVYFQTADGEVRID
jgi:hypothetical protein